MCGLFGITTYDEKHMINLNEIITQLTIESAVRGADSTGISYNHKGKMMVHKEPKSGDAIKFNVPKTVTTVMGHTRHSTQGSELQNYNNHPFLGRTRDGTFSLAHNGMIVNDTPLRRSLHLPNTKIQTDSYIAVQLLERKQHLNAGTLKYMAETVEGSFSFSVLDDKNNLYLVKGDSPLVILHFPKQKLYAYASTAQILWRALAATELLHDLRDKAYEEIFIKGGNILRIDAQGKLQLDCFKYTDYSSFTTYQWWNCGADSAFSVKQAYKDAYMDDLLSVAQCMGYGPDEIEALMREGCSIEEIEELLYCGYGSYLEV